MGVVAEHSDRQTIRDVICHAGAGASAGAIAATFVCPLDVIKTRLQVHGMPSGQRGSIIVTSLQKIFKTEGVKGMYRGLSPTILALLPNWAVYFTVYEQLKGLLHTHGWFFQMWLKSLCLSLIISYETPVHGIGELTIGENMIAAAGAGAATAISTNPLWVVKTRLQTQGMRPGVIPYKSMRSAFSRIATEEGLRGLYSGILPSLAGISHVAIQFPAYEKIKSFMAKRDNTTVDKLHPSRVAFASSVSKVIASVITYPHEVVRSRLQEQGQARHIEPQYAGVIDCMKKVFQKEGLRGFYNGCATNLLRTTPSAVITFTSYEMIDRFLRRVVLTENEHSGGHPKSDGHAEPQKGNGGTEREGNDSALRQAQAQTNQRTPLPLGNKDPLTARH
ncbi:nicotinamide adenine dinucleotide transporter 2, mitochondrial-like isoform X1 [Malus sylvestris]|uniref:nicotinamide adenine dinucleotide transporter 2, mitochondrial-like isoform X1 n=1 Tax=Malus sylvestris TaxID=3752 RepID=UPI0021AC9CB9|nr:nicotinamide adenine dinucleotide transporter 2, mitochondrial-like isoform X1 [Malus sylvestris]